MAAPVGAIGVLIIRRTLAHGRLHGFVSGLGVATIDATFAFIAAFGLTFLTNLLIGAQPVVRLIGGGFLIYLGLKTFLTAPAENAAAAPAAGGLRGAYLSALLLTATNPATILLFAGIFAGAGLAGAEGDGASAALMVAGVFAGSVLWWLILSGGVALLRVRFTPGVMRWVNRVSGVILIAFGAGALRGLL